MKISDVLFSPHGRIGQQNFWIGVLIILGANILLTWIPLLGWLIWLGLFYVGFCVYGKRLHDIGKSMWIHAIFLVVSLLVAMIAMTMAGGSIIALAMNSSSEPDVAAIMSLIGSMFSAFAIPMVIAIIYTIWLGVAKGDAGDNRFGPPESAAAATPPPAPEPTVTPAQTPPPDNTPPPSS